MLELGQRETAEPAAERGVVRARRQPRLRQARPARAIGGKPAPEFPAPGNIVFTTTETGQQEAFIAGTEPGAEIR